MKYNTRDIAAKLNRYGMTLRAELATAQLAADLTNSDAAHELVRAIESELESTQEMSTYLWDAKETI
jgi:hypothetical protein